MEESANEESNLLRVLRAQLRFLTLNLQWHQSVKRALLQQHSMRWVLGLQMGAIEIT